MKNGELNSPTPLFRNDRLKGILEKRRISSRVKVDEICSDFQILIDDNRALRLLVYLVFIESLLLRLQRNHTESDIICFEQMVEFFDSSLIFLQEENEGLKAAGFIFLRSLAQNFNNGLSVKPIGPIQEHLTRRCKSIFSNRADLASRVRSRNVVRIVRGWLLSRLQT